MSPAAAKPQKAPDAYSLIAAVNALRISYGLTPYNVNPILMGTAQSHAEYMSRNGVSHDEGGITFAERLGNAGYPLGVFRSENISAGMNQSVEATVLQWQGDDLHWHTMMSPDLTEIGAGVAIVNGYVYYTIDCATPLGAKPPPANTLAPGETRQPVATVYIGPPLARTVVPNTPNADGKLVHVVGPGETLWLIAVTYKVTILEIRELNYMSDTDAIYPGEKLLIHKGLAGAAVAVDASPSPLPTDKSTDEPTNESVIPAPDVPTATFAPAYTSTPLPTLPLPTPVTPTASPAVVARPAIAMDWSLIILIVIVLAALALAGMIVRTSRKDHS